MFSRKNLHIGDHHVWLKKRHFISGYSFTYIYVNPLYTGNPKAGTLANSEDPDEMQLNAAFHRCLRCLLRLKQPLGTGKIDLENSTCDPLQYMMGSPILIASICMGKSIRIQRVED